MVDPGLTFHAVSEEARRATLTMLDVVGAFETGANGDWVWVSPKLSEMLGGIPVSSLLGREWIRLVHPDDRDRVIAEYRQAREFGRQWVQRFRMLTIDQVPLRVAVSASVLPHDPNKRAVAHIGLVKDVSANVRAEELSAQAGQTLQDIAELMSEGLLIVRDTYVLVANSAAARIAGVSSPEDLIGKRATEFLELRDRAQFEALANSPNETIRTGTVVRRDNGAPVMLTVHGRPIMYAGAPARMVSFLPIDDPLIRSATLDRNFRRLAALESLLPIAYHRVSLGSEDLGTIEYANQLFCDMVGWKPEDLLGRSVLDITAPSDREDSLTKMRERAHLEGRLPAVPRDFIRPDGVIVQVMLNSAIYRDPITHHPVSMSLSTPRTNQDNTDIQE